MRAAIWLMCYSIVTLCLVRADIVYEMELKLIDKLKTHCQILLNAYYNNTFPIQHRQSETDKKFQIDPFKQC